jgi:hypothetical protein
MAYVDLFTEEERQDLIRQNLKKLEDLNAEVKRTESVLAKLGVPQKTSAPADASDYRSNWSWTLKIKYALKKTKRCLTSREIVEVLEGIDKDLGEGAINSVSGTLSTKATKKIIFDRYQPYEGADYFYGLNDWFENGTVKNEYKAD